MARVIGLMSGTSADGVDAGMFDIRRKTGRVMIRLVAESKVTYRRRLRERLLQFDKASASADELADLNVAVGKVFATAALKIIKSTAATGGAPQLLGSHGQTVAHAPESGITLQIGEPAIISTASGLDTWSDFRVADVAMGGQGAPLAPIVHLPLFADDHFDVTVINIGGIANLTYIPAGATRLGDLRAYDTGPGCMLIDLCARQLGKDFDRDGAMAARGTCDPRLLRRFLTHPYFLRKAPKSAGREIFGQAFLDWAGLKRRQIANMKTVATFTELTARSIVDGAVKTRGKSSNPWRIVLCGGGALNIHLARRIAQMAGSKAQVSLSDEHGMPCHSVETALIALLAYYAQRGEALDLRKLTGSSCCVRLGKKTPAPAAPAIVDKNKIASGNLFV